MYPIRKGKLKNDTYNLPQQTQLMSAFKILHTSKPM